MPGEQSTEHTTLDDGVLEDVEVSTSPVHGNPGGGVLATPEAGASENGGIAGASHATTAQADDDEEQP